MRYQKRYSRRRINRSNYRRRRSSPAARRRRMSRIAKRVIGYRM
jgi:hypothetical protein